MKFYFICPIILFSLIAGSACQQKQHPSLFPDRDIQKKRSVGFFDRIDLEDTRLAKVRFYVQSDNYLSAYLRLSRLLVSIDSVTKWISSGNDNINRLKFKFEKIKKGMRISTYEQSMNEIGFDNLQLLISMIESLHREYKNNTLRGNRAYHYWNILLKISDSVTKKRNRSVSDIAVLSVISKFYFFKNHSSWETLLEKDIRGMQAKEKIRYNKLISEYQK